MVEKSPKRKIYSPHFQAVVHELGTGLPAAKPAQGLQADYRALHLISSYLKSACFYGSALKNASCASDCN